MNKKKTKLIMALGSIVILIACGSKENRQSVEVNTVKEVKKEKQLTADIADASFKDGMTGKAFHNYLQLKMALVNSDADEAAKVAANMAEGVTDERAEIKTLAEGIANNTDLEEQRSLFSNLTLQLSPLIEQNLAAGTIYKKYCPMAFNGDGAYWLSDVTEINNPYFGSKMLRCGKIDQTISK